MQRRELRPHVAQPVRLSLKIVLLGLLDALAVWASAVLAADGGYGLLAALIIGCAAINVVFLPNRLYPWRYLLPGLICMAAMVVYPLLYTVYIAFTNYGTGHLLTKAQVVEQVERRTFTPADAPLYPYNVYQNERGDLRILLTAPDGTRLLSEGGALRPFDPATPGVVDADADGTPEQIGAFHLLGRLEMVQVLGRLQSIELSREGQRLRVSDLSNFQEQSPRYRYEAGRDAIVSIQSDKVYRAQGGYFVAEDGERLLPGFRSTVGWANFSRLVSDSRVRGPFLRVFTWTVIWAFASVATTFIMGLGLAILLNDPRLRLRNLYRSMLIVPYALPAFISALIWRGFFNQEVGIVNEFLQATLNLSLPWLQDPFWAKIALILVNLWLGFPYMMIICLGALQSIPSELYAAAEVDGARAWQQFRHVTLPMLLISLAPLLIAAFAFNFNNFNVIYLLTQGRPPIPGAETPAGATDILISYTYRLAFESGSGGNYGLASAVALLIFIIIGAITWWNFRFTGTVERMSEDV